MNYYNEHDPKAAAWLRELIAAGEIPPGDVDERDIRDVTAAELDGYTQCHFFAGIGGWSLALRLAGWPADRPVWTGSCPCQPFSAAGRRGGAADERHLWPHWFHLIEICRPSSVFGEQVASKDGLGWLDLVQADLEGAGYAIGASDLCAAGVGAPHIRQRLFFGAYDTRPAADRLQHPARDGRQERWSEPSGRGTSSGCGAGLLGDSLGAGLEGHSGHGDGARGRALADRPASETGATGDLADSERDGQHGRGYARPRRRDEPANGSSDGEFAGRIDRPGPTNGFWRNADWLRCRDDKWRPVEPSAQQMADGLSAAMGRLRVERNGEDGRGKKSEGYPDQELQDMRSETGTSKVQRSLGRLLGLRKEGVLQSDMHGRGLRGDDQSSEREKQSSSIREDSKGCMREMRKVGASCASPGREPDEQRPAQPRKPLRFLSQEGTPAPGCYPLAAGIRHRVGLLRGYGNAIVPEKGALFIRAFEEARKTASP